ncbi:MAG: porin family protein [Fibrobacteria bacterium]
MNSTNARHKLRYLLVLGLTLAPLTVSAISLGVGPKGGMNFGNADVEDHKDTEGRQGLAIGGQVEFGVSNPWSLQIEPMYVQKGARFDILGVTTRGNFDYFEVPVLVKAKFGAPTGHAYLFAGPSFGINLQTEGKIMGATGNFEDESAPIVYSGDVGVGGEFQLVQYVFLTADVRYSHAFTSALDKSVGDIDHWKSRDVRAMAGVMFHLTN